MAARHDALGEGVRPVDGWLLVEAVDPGLVTTWRAAQETFAAEEQGFHERNADFQNSRGIPRRRVLSPFATALGEAEAAVAEAVEGMIVEGTLVFAGFPAGQLDGAPVPIPLAALAGRRPKSPRFTVHGITFYRVRLFPAEALAAAEPEPEVDTPPATIPELVKVLTALFAEQVGWEKAGTEHLAALVAARDSRFRPHQGSAKAGRWSERTLHQRIREVRVEARSLAGS